MASKRKNFMKDNTVRCAINMRSARNIDIIHGQFEIDGGFPMEQLGHIISGGLHILAAVTWIGSMIYSSAAVTPALSLWVWPRPKRLTAELNIPTPPGGLPTLLINDGIVLEENLREIGHDESWLRQMLRKNGIGRMEDGYAAIIDAAGTFHYSAKIKS